MPAEKKTPERRCTGCGEHRPKSELIRIVRQPSGKTEVDRTGKKPGRGAYVCYDEKCLARALKRLSRSLSAEVGPEVAAELNEMINGHR